METCGFRKGFVLAHDALARQRRHHVHAFLPGLLAHVGDLRVLGFEGHALFQFPAQDGERFLKLAGKLLEMLDKNTDHRIRQQQRDIQTLGVTRDTNYLATYPGFMLREDEDEFVIVYGVNHERTGKATYAAVGAYSDLDRWFGMGSTLSRDFGDSAREYLPGDPEADRFYVLKVARYCGEGEDYCMQIDQPKFLDLWGNPYKTHPDCSLDNLATEEYDPSPFNLDEQKLFFIFRSYMEPATLVGPDDNELLYDRAIYFGPYFTEQ